MYFSKILQGQMLLWRLIRMALRSSHILFFSLLERKKKIWNDYNMLLNFFWLSHSNPWHIYWPELKLRKMRIKYLVKETQHISSVNSGIWTRDPLVIPKATELHVHAPSKIWICYNEETTCRLTSIFPQMIMV